MSESLNIFILYLFFITIIFIAIFLYFFSKWHIYGPKFNLKLKNLKSIIKKKFDKNKPKIKKGIVVVKEDFTKEPTKDDYQGKNAQEILKIQKEISDRKKQIKIAEEKIEEKEKKLREKIELKNKNKILKQKQKEFSQKQKKEKKIKKIKESKK